MSKSKSTYFCQNCGAQSSKWVGKCPACGEWNTYVEEIIQKDEKSSWKSSSLQIATKPRLIKEIDYREERSHETRMSCDCDFSDVVRRKSCFFETDLQKRWDCFYVGTGGQLWNYSTPFLKDKILRETIEGKNLRGIEACIHETDWSVITACFNPKDNSFFQISFFASADSDDPG